MSTIYIATCRPSNSTDGVYTMSPDGSDFEGTIEDYDTHMADLGFSRDEAAENEADEAIEGQGDGVVRAWFNPEYETTALEVVYA